MKNTKPKRATRKAATKKRRSNKAPSAKQLAARRKFAMAAKARAKAAKAGKRARNASIDLGNNEKVSIGIFKQSNGEFLALTRTQSKYFKTYRAAEAWLRKRGYTATGQKIVPNKTIISKPKRVIVLNPGATVRRKVRNSFVSLRVHGQAKKTPTGWKLGNKTFPQGTGIVPATRKGFYLDRATGTVFSKVAKNAEKRNPKKASKVRQLRETFTGTASRKTATMNASEGTPANLAKLGKLILIKTQRGTIQPASGTTWLCADAKGKLHLTTTVARLIDGPAQNFGEVSQIEYEATKPHLGHTRPTIFFHKMGEEGGKRPVLIADGKGGLKLRGGSYRIEREGIVD